MVIGGPLLVSIMFIRRLRFLDLSPIATTFAKVMARHSAVPHTGSVLYIECPEVVCSDEHVSKYSSRSTRSRLQTGMGAVVVVVRPFGDDILSPMLQPSVVSKHVSGCALFAKDSAILFAALNYGERLFMAIVMMLHRTVPQYRASDGVPITGHGPASARTSLVGSCERN